MQVEFYKASEALSRLPAVRPCDWPMGWGGPAPPPGSPPRRTSGTTTPHVGPMIAHAQDR